METLILVGALSVLVAAIAQVFIWLIRIRIRRLKAELHHLDPAHTTTGIALLHYDRSDGRFWIETLVDLDSLSAPVLVQMGNFMYTWTQSLWRAKVDNAG